MWGIMILYRKYRQMSEIKRALKVGEKGLITLPKIMADTLGVDYGTEIVLKLDTTNNTLSISTDEKEIEEVKLVKVERKINRKM